MLQVMLCDGLNVDCRCPAFLIIMEGSRSQEKTLCILLKLADMGSLPKVMLQQLLIYMGKFSCSEKLHMKRELCADDQCNAKRFGPAPKHGTGNWMATSKKAELGKYGKSCRLKRADHMKSGLQQESFTQQEEELIIKLHAAIGSRWAIIAQQLPGRTDNDVKNIWNTKLRKKLTAMGIDPVTHRPFSQILADYGNIGAFPKARTRFGSLSRNIRTAFMLRSENPQIPPERESGFGNSFRAASATAQMDTSKASLLSNNDESLANNQSPDLLSQLQAITLVTEASNYTHHEFKPPELITDASAASASSSSKSPSSSTNQAMASLAFNWSDFLLEDAFPSANALEQINLANSPADMNPEENQDSVLAEEGKDVEMKNNFEASSPSSSSFVEAILESEHGMQLDFQGLLEEPFYY